MGESESEKMVVCEFRSTTTSLETPVLCLTVHTYNTKQCRSTPEIAAVRLINRKGKNQLLNPKSLKVKSELSSLMELWRSHGHPERC